MQPQAFAWGWSGYAGANQSEKRGLLNWPTLETREELDSWSRSELIRKIRYLAANEGVVKGFVRNAPNFIGARTPKPKTKDKEWNLEAKRRFEDRCGTAAAFDVAGKFDFWTAQKMLLRKGFTDGDLLTALTESQGGAAMFGFYEAHQFANPKEASENWRDGVLIDANGRHLAYGIRDGKKGTVKVLNARNVHYFGTFDSPGHVRVIPPLAHCVNHAQDRMEVRSNTKEQIKGASLAAMVREREAQVKSKSKDGLGGILQDVTAPNGGTYSTAVVGYSGQVLDLEPGVTSKILHDDRPSPNQMEFMDSLVRDMANGFGLPPEVIYKMGSLTGPGIRFVLDVADAWIKEQQEELEKWCRLVWIYTIAKEIKYKGLRLPEDGRWWDVSFSGIRNLTIDRSKEMKSRMEVVESGYDTAENFCEEMFGSDADEVDEAHVARVKRRMDLCKEAGVPYEVAFPPRQGAAVGAKPGDEEEEEEEEEKGKSAK